MSDKPQRDERGRFLPGNNIGKKSHRLEFVTYQVRDKFSELLELIVSDDADKALEWIQQNGNKLGLFGQALMKRLEDTLKSHKSYNFKDIQWFIEFCFNYGIGKPKQQVEHTASDEGIKINIDKQDSGL